MVCQSKETWKKHAGDAPDRGSVHKERPSLAVGATLHHLASWTSKCRARNQPEPAVGREVIDES